MGAACCITNDPNGPVTAPYTLSGQGFAALISLGFFYGEDYSKIIDRLLKEKAAELGRPQTCYINYPTGGQE